MTNGFFWGCFGHFNMYHHLKSAYCERPTFDLECCVPLNKTFSVVPISIKKNSDMYRTNHPCKRPKMYPLTRIVISFLISKRINVFAGRAIDKTPETYTRRLFKSKPNNVSCITRLGFLFNKVSLQNQCM